MEQYSNQTSKILYVILNFMKKICVKNYFYFCDVTPSSTSVFNCIHRALYAFCFSVSHSTDFYLILLVSLELNELKKYFSKYVELDDFLRNQLKGFEEKSF